MLLLYHDSTKNNFNPLLCYKLRQTMVEHVDVITMYRSRCIFGEVYGPVVFLECSSNTLFLLVTWLQKSWYLPNKLHQFDNITHLNIFRLHQRQRDKALGP